MGQNPFLQPSDPNDVARQKLERIAKSETLHGTTRMLQVGTTPFEFIQLTWNAVYGKWVSPTQVLTGHHGGRFGVTSLYPDSSAPVEVMSLVTNAKSMYDAGLRPQFFFAAQLSAPTSATVYAAIGGDQFSDDGSNTRLSPTTPGSYHCVVISLTAPSTGGATKIVTSGWVPPALNTLSYQHWRLVYYVSSSSTTAAVDASHVGAMLRWVSA